MGKNSKKKNYLDNDTLTEEILKCKESKIASEELGKMFTSIVENVARSFYWENKDDGDDCKANALFDLCKNFWKYEKENGNAFAFCTQIAYFGIAGGKRVLYPKKYENTISISCIDDNGKKFDMYNI